MTPRQIDMFGPDEYPKARTTDPLPSKVAAAQIEATGKAKNHRQRILVGIVENPGRNCREVARILGMEAYAVTKRVTELHRRDLIAPGATDESARRWWATATGILEYKGILYPDEEI